MLNGAYKIIKILQNTLKICCMEDFNEIKSILNDNDEFLLFIIYSVTTEITFDCGHSLAVLRATTFTDSFNAVLVILT